MFTPRISTALAEKLDFSLYCGRLIQSGDSGSLFPGGLKVYCQLYSEGKNPVFDFMVTLVSVDKSFESPGLAITRIGRTFTLNSEVSNPSPSSTTFLNCLNSKSKSKQ
ncbi:hypothetical protein D3C86_1969270 [compost metagenome]